MNMDHLPFNLDDVLINSQLVYRTSGPRNYQAEEEAIIALAQTMAYSPQLILQKLVETALQLCRADTAGISLLEEQNGEEVFRWEALAGVYADRINATMPRHASPCGVTIERDTTQLMYMAERLFPALKAEPPVVEALLIPFHVEDKPIGTVWVVAHDERRKFDREDERIVKTLAQFASAAWQLWKARNSAEVAARTEKQHAAALAAINELLQVQVSERKRAEEQLRQLNLELETRVQEKTAAFVEANADLWRALEEGKRLQEQLRQSQKMESIGTLACGLAHDFNNLLHIIQAYALAIVRHSGDAEKVIEDVQVIRETVQDGAALVQQLFTVARKTEVKFVATDINGLLQRLSKILTETFPKTLTITLEFDPQVPNVNVDANQIYHAVLNLCINARDAMPDSGNLVLRTRTVSAAQLCDRFNGVAAERYLCISVKDTGLGMVEGIKSRIFDPFFTTKEPGRGTGLGLSAVYGIVRNQDGFIEVASEPGRGSAFHIYLPIPKDQAASVDIGQPFSGKKGSGRAGSGETILCVEDDVRQLHLMQSSLEGEGFRVLTARDGAQAVDLHFRHKDEIAVVILDLGLAKLNGWKAFQRMKEANPKLKGILASGHLPREAELQIASGVLSGIIQKPYDVEEVLAKIEGAIRGA